MLGKIELISASLPPIDNCLDLHKDNLMEPWFIPLGLIPMGAPRKLKGKVPIEHDKKEEVDSKKSTWNLRPKNLLLYKFTFKPDVISMPHKMTLRLHKLFQDQTQGVMASSTNSNISMWSLSLRRNPYNSFKPVAFCTILVRLQLLKIRGNGINSPFSSGLSS